MNQSEQRETLPARWQLLPFRNRGGSDVLLACLPAELRRGSSGLRGASPERLPVRSGKPYSSRMEVHVTPETAKKLSDLAAASGRAPEKIVEDALAGYLDHVASVRETLDSRYDDLKSGRVKPIDGETFFETLRQREEDLLKRRRR